MRITINSIKRPKPAAKAIHIPKFKSGKESILSVCLSNHFFPDDHLNRIVEGSNTKQAIIDAYKYDIIIIRNTSLSAME